MTYYGGRELAASFRTVRKNTIQIAEDIPEEKYSFKPAADTRSIGQTFVHLAFGTSFPHHIHANRINDIMKVNFAELDAENFRRRSKTAEQGRNRGAAALRKETGLRRISTTACPIRSLPRR